MATVLAWALVAPGLVFAAIYGTMIVYQIVLLVMTRGGLRAPPRWLHWHEDR